MALNLLSKVVASAGTRVSLSAAVLQTAQALIQAKSTNTGKIYVGGSAVSSTLKMELGPPQTGATLPSIKLQPTDGSNSIDLSTVYIDAEVSGEGVNVLYEPFPGIAPDISTFGFFNPIDYGAVCDGVTDDTAAVQAAINAAYASSTVGGYVLIPYKCIFGDIGEDQGDRLDHRWDYIDLKKNVTIFDFSDDLGRPSIISHGKDQSNSDDNELLVKSPMHTAVILDVPKFKTEYAYEYSGNDLVAAADHLTSYKVTSAGNPFDPTPVTGDIGKYIYVKSGTNWTFGVYKIVNVVGSSAVLNSPAATANNAIGGVFELCATTCFNRSFGTRLFGDSQGFQLSANGDGSVELNIYKAGTRTLLDPHPDSLGKYYRLFISRYEDNAYVGVLRGAPAWPLDVDGGIRVSTEAAYSQSGMTFPRIVLENVDEDKSFSLVLQNTTGDLLIYSNGTILGRITPAGRVGIATGANSPTAYLDINDSIIRLRAPHTPSHVTDSGNAGDICWDSSYFYVCVATNTWKRAALSTWT